MIKRVQACEAEIDLRGLETAITFTTLFGKVCSQGSKNEVNLAIQELTIRVKNRGEHFFRRRASSEDIRVQESKYTDKETDFRDERSSHFRITTKFEEKQLFLRTTVSLLDNSDTSSSFTRLYLQCTLVRICVAVAAADRVKEKRTPSRTDTLKRTVQLS